jgi:hypothetical protein
MITTTFALHFDIWGISSVGRALAWHARGHRFESVILHKKALRKLKAFSIQSKLS